MDQWNDRRIVRRMMKGDEDAFTSFFDRYVSSLYRFTLMRVADEGAAEEIVQSTMTTAVRRIGTWRGEAALFTWLCTICRNEISTWAARNGRRPESIELREDRPEIRAALDSLMAAEQSPEASLQKRETARMVQAALDLLPGRYGDVLEWKYIEGLSVAEIADRLGVGLKAAESMLSRARPAFRETFTTLAAEVAPGGRHE